MKPSEVRVKNAFVPGAGTRKAEVVMPSRVRSEPRRGIARRPGYTSDPRYFIEPVSTP